MFFCRRIKHPWVLVFFRELLELTLHRYWWTTISKSIWASWVYFEVLSPFGKGHVWLVLVIISYVSAFTRQ
jgi:hypothetical protein